MNANTPAGHVKTILELLRIRNVFISLLGVYVGALLFSLGSPMPAYNIIAAALSAALILGGGNALNDYFDYQVDIINKPNRPIPSHRITRSDTLMLTLTIFLIGLALAKSINPLCFRIATFNTLMLIIYARYSKKMLFTSNIFISYLTASVFIYGAAAVYNPTIGVGDGLKLAAVLTICAFFTNLSREIIKDIEDIEGDRKNYSITLPIRYGPQTAKTIAIASGLVSIVISLVPLISPTDAFNELVYAIIIIPTGAIILASYKTHETVNQRLLVFAMTAALIAFLTATIIPKFIHTLP